MRTTLMSHQRSNVSRRYVKCHIFAFSSTHSISKIYHPNVDLAGNVCLNILREDWKPVLNLNSVMVGLQYLFLEPNADDPLNKGKWTSSRLGLVAHSPTEAAEELKRNRDQFIYNVKSSMRGGTIKGEKYDVVIKE